jgi:hypothetical protein
MGIGLESVCNQFKKYSYISLINWLKYGLNPTYSFEIKILNLSVNFNGAHNTTQELNTAIRTQENKNSLYLSKNKTQLMV